MVELVGKVSVINRAYHVEFVLFYILRFMFMVYLSITIAANFQSDSVSFSLSIAFSLLVMKRNSLTQNLINYGFLYAFIKLSCM